MEASVVSLEGDALKWFHWEYQQQPIYRGEELKTLILDQFRPMDQGSLHEQWMDLQQIGTVVDYQLDFIEKANPLCKIY